MVYQGLIPGIAAPGKKDKKPVFESPMSIRLRAVLDDISPLNLTDPESPNFSPEGCQSLHDIVRFAHEKAVQAMFGMAPKPTTASFRRDYPSTSPSCCTSSISAGD